MFRVTIVVRALPAASLLLAVAGTNGATIDLTTAGSQGTAGGAIFRTSTTQPVGTGVFNAFVRLQSPGSSTTEQGYNTSGRPVPFNELNDIHTRNLTLGEVPIVNIGGTNYYEFRLDTNEPSGGGNNLVSLDALQLYTSTVGSQTTTNVASLGTLRYDLGPNVILINDSLSHGSGQGDIAVDIPVSNFGSLPSSTFLYLFSRFGDVQAAQGGFEEWGVVAIPLPPSAPAGALVLGVLAARAVKRRNTETGL